MVNVFHLAVQGAPNALDGPSLFHQSKRKSIHFTLVFRRQAGVFTEDAVADFTVVQVRPAVGAGFVLARALYLLCYDVAAQHSR